MFSFVLLFVGRPRRSKDSLQRVLDALDIVQEVFKETSKPLVWVRKEWGHAVFLVKMDLDDRLQAQHIHEVLSRDRMKSAHNVSVRISTHQWHAVRGYLTCQYLPIGDDVRYNTIHVDQNRAMQTPPPTLVSSTLVLPPRVERRIFGGGRWDQLDFVTVQNTVWPVNLTDLQFGPRFNQNIDVVRLSHGLKFLSFGREFNQPLTGARWPAMLEKLVF